MIATHNIKVNGKWIRAGEEYGEPAVEKKPAESIQEPVVEAQAEEKKAEAKPKTATRRKVSK